MIKKIFELVAGLHGDKTFEDVVKEWHSFWIGWAEMATFGIRPQVPINEYALGEMSKEWHYYNIGRAAGVVMWFLIGLLVALRCLL